MAAAKTDGMAPSDSSTANEATVMKESGRCLRKRLSSVGVGRIGVARAFPVTSR